MVRLLLAACVLGPAGCGGGASLSSQRVGIEAQSGRFTVVSAQKLAADQAGGQVTVLLNSKTEREYLMVVVGTGVSVIPLERGER